MSDWTPGPWVPLYDDRVSVPEDTNGSLSIAHVYACREQPANQRLIAAAPELADALRELTDTTTTAIDLIESKRKRGDFDHWESFTMGDWGGAIERARAALAKLEAER